MAAANSELFSSRLNIAMDFSLLIDNLLNPAVLFFFLGLTAVLVRSDLEIPQPIPKILSLYLLLAIGFKGGVGLSASGLSANVFITLLAAILIACLVPVYSFFLLRTKLDAANAAAIAAAYGSVSAVTFVTAAAFLDKLGISFGGHLVAAMALMESPAIVIGVLFYKLYSGESRESNFSWRELLREAFFNAPVVLIIGSLTIGFLTGEAGARAMKPFTGDIFAGLLAFFLLDMGLVAAKRLGDLRRAGAFLIVFAVVIPIFNGLVGIGVAKLVALSTGDSLMLAVLCASASYIAVPAAVRISIPKANPSLYLPMALGVTFPFNIVIGLPLYLYIIENI